MPVIRFDVEEKATSLDAPVTHKVTANKTPILAGGNDADPIDSMATVSQYLADRYGESARDVNRNYETVARITVCLVILLLTLRRSERGNST